MSIIHYASLHIESARTALKELLRQPRHAAHPPDARRRDDPAAVYVFGHSKRAKRVGQTQRVAANHRLYGNRRRTKRQRYRPQPAGARQTDRQRPLHRQGRRLGGITVQPRPKFGFDARRQPAARRIYRYPRPRDNARANAGNLPGHYQTAYGRIRVYGYRMGANAVPNQRIYP